MNRASSTDGFVETETSGALIRFATANPSCGLGMNPARFALNNRLSEVLLKNGHGTQHGISDARMTLHLPLGGAAPHKMIRSSESERLQHAKSS